MSRIKLAQEFLPTLTDPEDNSPFSRIDESAIYFQNGRSYPVFEGTPILFNEKNSLFAAREIFENKPTTQDKAYRSSGHLKNYIRQRILPSLSKDSTVAARYIELGKKIQGGTVFVIGAGDKADFYKACFQGANVILSDVHCQFGVDVVIDSHNIPFKDNTFDLVLAAQVLEHTIRPWQTTVEIQRVVRPGGYIQIEVPFAFPYHAAPYDFYRFTPTALRILFSKSELVKLTTPEGRWSAAAVSLSEALIDSFKGRTLRSMALFGGRMLFGWLKYLDKLPSKPNLNMPKGFAATYRYDGKERSDKDLLIEATRFC